MERVKRDLEAAPQHGYSSANPWSAVFFAATKDMEFWSKEVVIPGTPLGEGQQAGEVQEKERLFRYRTHLYSQEERLSQEEEEV